MFQTKVIEKIESTFLLNDVFLGNRTVYETKWKSRVETDRQQMTILPAHGVYMLDN